MKTLPRLIGWLSLSTFSLQLLTGEAKAQPTPSSTSTSLIVNRSTGAITGPVSAATFKSANGITGGGGGSYTFTSPLVDTSGTVTINNAAADGSTKGAAAFAAADFNAASGVISLDYTNGQAATGSVKGFLTASDWTTFNAKLSPSNNLSDLASASTARTNLGLAIGTNVQAYDADLTTYAGITPSANVQSLLGAANYAAMRALLDLEAGTDFLGYPTGTPTGSKFLRDDNSWQTISGGGDALVANPLSQFAATTSSQLAGVISDETGTGAAVFASDPLLLFPNSAMGALAVDVTKRTNTKSISADSTLTFSATPTAGATFGLTLTNSDSAAHTITIPSSYSLARQAAITTFTIGAGAKAELSWRYDGSTYFLVGDPSTINDLSDVTVVAADKLPLYDTSAGTDGKSTVSAVVLAGLPAFSGDATSSAGASALTLATVNSNVGTFGSATAVGSVTVNAKGLVTAASNITVTPAVGSIAGLGTNVATALGNAADGTGGFTRKAYVDSADATLLAYTDSAVAAAISDTAYDATSWNGVSGNAPSKNAVRDKVETMVTDIAAKTTASSTETFTNKTFDAAGTGNVLKFKDYIYLTTAHLADGTGATINTTATAISYGHATFSHSADEAANYVEYYFMVPEDIDTSVALRARLKILLGGSDTGTHRYVLSSVSVADSAVPTASTLANAINIDFAGDGSGASGDVETSAWTTLTSWAGALTAGQTWRIRLARDGNATEDGSSVNSTELGLVIEYGKTQ